MTQGGYGGGPGANPFGSDPFTVGSPVSDPVHPVPPTTGPPGAPETNTLATLSVVFAFVFAPAGAILGHLGLRQIARTGQRGRDRALIGITSSYLVITAAVVSLLAWAALGDNGSADAVASSSTSSTSPVPESRAPSCSAVSTTPSPPAPPKVDATALPSVLAPLEELRTILGDQGLTALGTSAAPEMPEGATFDDATCLASFVGGTPMAYELSNQRQLVGADAVNTTNGQQVDQVAVRFDDDTAAEQALSSYLEQWRACTGRTAKWTLTNGRVVTISYGAPQDAGGGITVLENTVAELTSVQFSRVIAVKANVLVDNGISGASVGAEPVTLTRAMLDRVPN